MRLGQILSPDQVVVSFSIWGYNEGSAGVIPEMIKTISF